MIHKFLDRIIFSFLIWSLSIGVSNAQVQYKDVHSLQINVSDGLIQSRVEDLVCDNNGVVWLNQRKTLQVWDGHSVYTIIDSLIETSPRYNIYPSPFGGILVSTSGVMRLLKYEGLEFRTIYSSGDESDEFLPVLIESQDSPYLLVAPNHVIQLDTSLKTSKGKVKDFNVTSENESRCLFNLGSKSFILIKSTGKIIEMSNFQSAANNKIFEESSLRNNYTVYSNGNAYLNTEHLMLNQSDAYYEIPFPKGAFSEYYQSVYSLNDDFLLVGIDDRLFEFDILNRKWTKEFKNVSQSKILKSGYFDRIDRDIYGNIWASTVNEGVLKIYNNDQFQYIGTDHKDKNFVKNIAVNERLNQVVVSSLENGMYVFDTSGILQHHLSKSNTNGDIGTVTGVYRSRPNHYIFNVNNDINIYQLNLELEKPSYSVIGQKDSEYLYYQDVQKVNDSLLYMNFIGLYQYDISKEELSRKFTHISNKSCLMKQGDYIWIGCNDELVKYNWVLDTPYEVIDMNGEGYIRTLETLEDGRIAMGSDKGLSIFNPIDKNVEVLKSTCIYCLKVDKEDGIWAGTGEGLIYVNAKGETFRFSTKDGIQGNEFNTNACELSESGKMYFGGMNGITVFDPSKIRRVRDDQKVVVKKMMANEDQLLINHYGSEDAHFVLAHDRNNLKFELGTLGEYESDMYQYQYAIDGLTDGWTDIGSQSSLYFSLAPGEYKFYFASVNKFDADLKFEKPYTVEIQSPWYSKWWFYSLIIVGLAGLISFIISSVQRQKHLKEKYDLDLKINLQDERISMSKELHDNIGSRLTFLVSSIENIENQATSNLESKEKLSVISSFGKETINDLRSMVWVLKSDKITVQDLQLKILDFISIARQSSPDIEFSFIENVGDMKGVELKSKTSQNLFRIVQEAIHNLVKYSESSIADISMRFEKNEMNIQIYDEGVGFDSQAEHMGYGLKNIISRTKNIDGQCLIQSTINEGTRIVIRVPI